MSDTDREKTADKLDRTGEEPAAESGAGYGSHAAEVEKAANQEGGGEEKSA